MSDVSQGPGWWQASDGRWYAPDLHPGYQASVPADQTALGSPLIGSDQVFPAADSASVFQSVGSDQVFPAADSASVFQSVGSDQVFTAADDTPVFAAAGSAFPAFPAAGSDPVFATPDQSAPAAYPSVQYPNVRTSRNKSKVAAGLLAIFLGALGVHRFYMGYKLIGVIMLLITVASLGRLAVISGLWGIVEGILIFAGKMHKDKYGDELT